MDYQDTDTLEAWRDNSGVANATRSRDILSDARTS
jgi:hypothetical protein